jgi:hypothetical protein
MSGQDFRESQTAIHHAEVKKFVKTCFDSNECEFFTPSPWNASTFWRHTGWSRAMSIVFQKWACDAGARDMWPAVDNLPVLTRPSTLNAELFEGKVLMTGQHLPWQRTSHFQSFQKKCR